MCSRVRAVCCCAFVVCVHAWPKRSGLGGSELRMYGLGLGVGFSEDYVSRARSLSLFFSLAPSFARALFLSQYSSHLQFNNPGPKRGGKS